MVNQEFVTFDSKIDLFAFFVPGNSVKSLAKEFSNVKN